MINPVFLSGSSIGENWIDHLERSVITIWDAINYPNMIT